LPDVVCATAILNSKRSGREEIKTFTGKQFQENGSLLGIISSFFCYVWSDFCDHITAWNVHHMP